MSDQHYAALAVLFHEFNKAFHALPDSIVCQFYARLYAK